MMQELKVISEEHVRKTRLNGKPNMEEPRAKPIHEVIDEGNGYLCNAYFCGNCGAEIYSDKCDKCGTIADENAE